MKNVSDIIKSKALILAVLCCVILFSLIYVSAIEFDKSIRPMIITVFTLVTVTSISKIMKISKTTKVLYKKAQMRGAVFSLLFLPVYAKDFWLIGNEFNKLCLILLFIFLVYQVYDYYKSGLLKFDGSFFSNEY